MQDIDLSLGPTQSFSPNSLRSGSFAKFSFRERRDSDSPRSSPAGGRSRRISQANLRDFASRAATDSPDLFEIPGFEANAPSPTPPSSFGPAPSNEVKGQSKRAPDLFKALGNAVLSTDASGLEALMDTYQSQKLQRSYIHIVDDFKEDKEHLSVLFRKTVIESRKKLSTKGTPQNSHFQTKICVDDVVKLMNELGEPVKVAQVVAFLQPAGYNAAVGPSVTFDDFFGWWCYYQSKVSEAESNGAMTSRSQ
jgi:hypothetical protein